MYRYCKRMVCLVLVLAILIPTAGISVYAQETAQMYTIMGKSGYYLVTNNGGKTLGYAMDSGVTLLEDSGYAFKDLNRNGELDPYEDWRISDQERAESLAGQMKKDGMEGIQSIAGLMLYSSHQPLKSTQITQKQEKYLVQQNLRHMLITNVASSQAAAEWNNKTQTLVEGLHYGIPVSSSSDPRHSGADAGDKLYDSDSGSDVSSWPYSIGLAATFEPDIVYQYGRAVAQEYRALGIITALSPQIDLASEPRWFRFNETFGEDTALTTDMSKAYIDALQTTEGAENGWGSSSVNAMTKHWPGGGAGESGRDAHFGFGKFEVYPGNNFAEHLLPFTDGAFQLERGTKKTAAVMPYFSISYEQDQKNHENVGNSFNKHIIGDLLRGEYEYDGVVCTDWGVTKDNPCLDSFARSSWGVERLTTAQRHYKALMAGVDQFGGNNEMEPILEAYKMMVANEGKAFADARFEDSARRILLNLFQVGLFENPYLDVAQTEAVVGSTALVEAGFDAQLKSVVMLKNADSAITPAQPGAKRKTAYVVGMEETLVSQYFDLTTDADKADLAIVCMMEPNTGVGYTKLDVQNGGNGFIPISLQYGTYIADTAREVSLASDPDWDGISNRSYKGKSVTAANDSELETLQRVSESMCGKPVITYLKATKPVIFSEVDPLTDALLIGYGIQDRAALEIISGRVEPSGLLPMQQPTDMETVEAQYEDVSHDMQSYVDTQGNAYDFAFGLNWGGRISDYRTVKYADNSKQTGAGALKHAVALAQSMQTQDAFKQCSQRQEEFFINIYTSAKELLEQEETGEPVEKLERIHLGRHLTEFFAQAEFEPDRLDLEHLYRLSERVDLNRFLNTGQDEFIRVRDIVSELLQQDSLSLLEIKDAWDGLLQGLNRLTPVPDKGKLKQLLTQAEQNDLTEFSEASVARLKKKIAEVKTMLNNQQVTQEELDHQVVKLKDAMDSLDLLEGRFIVVEIGMDPEIDTVMKKNPKKQPSTNSNTKDSVSISLSGMLMAASCMGVYRLKRKSNTRRQI